MAALGPGYVKTQKNSGPSKKSASQNARNAVFSVLGMVILATNILRFGVFTQPGAIAVGIGGLESRADCVKLYC